MDHIGLGRAFRAVRVRQGLRQSDVANHARTSTSTVSRVERGHVGALALDTLLSVATALEIRLDFVPRWRGADLDRMLGAGHGRMHEQIARLMRHHAAWLAVPEVSFAIYGERGVIDVLAFHAGQRKLLVIELKTQLVDVQELLSAVDRYRRLAPRLAAERGWHAGETATWVVLATRPRTAAALPPMRRSFGLRCRTTAAPFVRGCASRRVGWRRSLSCQTCIWGPLDRVPPLGSESGSRIHAQASQGRYVGRGHSPQSIA